MELFFKNWFRIFFISWILRHTMEWPLDSGLLKLVLLRDKIVEVFDVLIEIVHHLGDTTLYMRMLFRMVSNDLLDSGILIWIWNLRFWMASSKVELCRQLGLNILKLGAHAIQLLLGFDLISIGIGGFNSAFEKRFDMIMKRPMFDYISWSLIGVL